MDQLTWCGTLVASDAVAGGAVEVCEADDSLAGEDAVHGVRVEPQEVGDADWSQRRSMRTLMIRRSVRVGVRRGLWCGLEERSVMPASPRVR
ncbi:hypothetical protein GCM10010430_63560 [Kitasatospora cystarginea]|uniref:Uncharacterized protein n=1 Tax=Kitasatospora cystarginea TaxID=58350 RepID=A0ABN3ETF8_9ACTN